MLYTISSIYLLSVKVKKNLNKAPDISENFRSATGCHAPCYGQLVGAQHAVPFYNNFARTDSTSIPLPALAPALRTRCIVSLQT